MADIVSPAKRSEMMSGIKGKNTKPELAVRRLLHAAGFRFRLHRKDLPGSPDIVLPKYRLAILVNGCYWHGHDGCRLYRPPRSRTEFWIAKITKNRERDERSSRLLVEQGWRVLTVWECALKGARKIPPNQLSKLLAECIQTEDRVSDIAGEGQAPENEL